MGQVLHEQVMEQMHRAEAQQTLREVALQAVQQFFQGTRCWKSATTAAIFSAEELDVGCRARRREFEDSLLDI